MFTAINNPDSVSLYITLSRNSAKKIIWPELKKINANYKLGGREDLIELSMTFPNGSVIYVSGAKDASEIEKFRGLALKKAYIDECQSFRAHLKELIDDVLVPALMDHDGSLICIGTPGPVPAGYFAEISGACVKPGGVNAEDNEDDADFNWVPYHWTFFDNPHIALKSKKTHEQVLKRALKMRGVPATDPSIQREFYGKWVMDTNSLWIKYDATINHYDKLDEKKKWNYILGIDIGFNDADALAVVAWESNSNNMYLVEEIVTAKQDMSDLVSQIQSIQRKYNISKMVIDEGGLGKKMAEEMRRRHKLPLHPVEIDWDKSTPDRIRISDKYHSDVIDAVLYAFRESPAYAYEAPAAKPPKGTKEWAEQFEDGLWDEAMDHFKEQARMDRFNRGDWDE